MEALLWEGQMAVGLIMQFSGVDAAKYDAILKEAGLKGKNAVWPAGIISHAAGPTADGWCVVDVWSSQAQFDRFLSKTLKPAFDRAGGMPEPHVTTFQIHNKYHRAYGHRSNPSRSMAVSSVIPAALTSDSAGLRKLSLSEKFL